MVSASKRYLIIGSSAASIGVLGKLRRLDPQGQITCLTSSDVVPYNTCLLADYLSGDREAPSVFVKTQDFFDKQRITFVLKCRVTAIHRRDRIVCTETGERYGYDALFLGVGTSVGTPSIPGLQHTDQVFYFQTFADAQGLDQFVRDNPGKRAVIVGGGLSGIECSDALVQRGMKVTLVERASHILPAQVDYQGAQVIGQRMREEGVHLYENVAISSIMHHEDGHMTLTLSDKRVLRADALVLATGNMPNTSLAQDAGLTCVAGGIATNDHMQTSDPHIYAGGDCATVHDIVRGEYVRSCMWPDAMQQGMHAAAAMAGVPKPYPGVLIVGSSRFYDTMFVSCGPVTERDTRLSSYVIAGDHYYGKFVCCDGQLVGFLLVGLISHVGLLRRAVIHRESIDRSWVTRHFAVSESSVSVT